MKAKTLRGQPGSKKTVETASISHGKMPMENNRAFSRWKAIAPTTAKGRVRLHAMRGTTRRSKSMPPQLKK